MALTTVVTVRSYSRISGDTSWEHVTSCPRARSAVATTLLVGRLEVGVQQAHGHPGGVRWDRRHRTGLDRRQLLPVGARRPSTSKRQARGTRGSGRTTAVS